MIGGDPLFTSQPLANPSYGECKESGERVRLPKLILRNGVSYCSRVAAL